MRDVDWRKYIYKVVIVVLVVFFVTGVGFGAKNILSIEGVRELYTPAQSLSPMPETEAEMLQYINDCIEFALDKCPEVKLTSSFSVDTASLNVTDGNKQILSAIKMALPEIEKRVKESFAEKTAAYSASADDFLGICSIDTADITEAAIDYEYYKCSLCTSEIAYKDYSTVCPECSSENTLQLRSYDTYKITMHIDPSSDSFFNNVFPKTENVKAVIADGAEGFYSLSDFNKLYDDVILYAEINRLTNQLKSLRFETVSNLSAGLEMSGAYEAYGNVDVGVTVKDRIIYNLSWPSVELDKHEITVEIGSSEVLKAKLTCDDPASYDVVWTSSDESVLTVDEKGYLKTKKIYGDSTVTAKFIFNGKEYQDSCLVHVGVPAEGVDLDKGKLSMKSGDTEQLNAVFNPKNTTNTVCYWYSEDESVAVVDENGNVTAVAKGNTVVYIISDYGNYYSSCKVEVTD